MIQPVIVGQAYKPFTDGTTWNGGGTSLTSLTINFTAESGYSFIDKDVAIVATNNNIYPTGSGWTQLVDGATSGSMDIWTKQGSGGATDFNSSWESSSGGQSLFFGGMQGIVLRTPFGSDGIYFDGSVAENVYSVSCTSNPTTRPAVARSVFEDSEFYYRIDADYVYESSGSYYSNDYTYSSGTTFNASSNYSANTSEFLNSAPAVIGFTLFSSSDMAGQAMNFNPINYYGGVGSIANFVKRVLWVRGFNPTSQGMML